MSWLKKLAECDWCGNEINGLCDPVHESEKGTLCSECEKGRVSEKEIHKDHYEQRRLQREIERTKRKMLKEDDNEGSS
jgi:hypothetical protein